MCGRYASFRQAQDLADTFDVADVTEDAAAVPPSFNVAPTQQVRVVLERIAEPERPVTAREMHAARWGLVPGWAKDPSIGSRMINARSETVAEKKAFAKPLATRRCILPADGYFEWRKDPRTGRKVPYFVHHVDATPVALAGLYSFWRDPTKAEDDPARWLLSATVLTRAARPELTFLHDREPVLLAGDAIAEWLDPTTRTVDGAMAVLTTAAPPVDLHPVDPRVGNVRNDFPELIDPVDA